jgi:hypothetical protein
MIADHVVELLQAYKQDGVILDSNLLLLFVIGTYDPNRISTFKNTQKYTAEDFVLLTRVLERVDRRVITPNIATEVDNLGRQLRENEYDKFADVFSQLCRGIFEVYVSTATATSAELYPPLGLTDSITIQLAQDNLLTITDDFELSNRLSSLGMDVININHIRLFS